MSLSSEGPGRAVGVSERASTSTIRLVGAGVPFAPDVLSSNVMAKRRVIFGDNSDVFAECVGCCIRQRRIVRDALIVNRKIIYRLQ